MAEDQSKKWEGGEDEDEELDEMSYKHAKDALLFAIDVSDSMLGVPEARDGKKVAELDSPLAAALKCAFTLMQQRIISHPNDMIGVLLYGTEQTKFQEDGKTKSGASYPHCYLLADLQIPAAEDVKTLRALLEDKDAFKTLMQPSSEGASLANVLFCANHVFATRAANFASRRLFIVTDNDNPHTNKDQRNAASVRAKDLYDLGVMIELFPIARADRGFDRSKFYDDIVYNPIPTDPEAPAPLLGPTKTSTVKDGISLLNTLLSSINSRSVPKRALFSNLPLEIGPNLRISVKGYILFKRQEIHKSSYIWLGGEKPMIAKSVSLRIADDNNKVVEKEAIRRAYKFGGEQVTFSNEEMASLRHFGDPIIRIIGFKALDTETLPIWANLGRSTFLYPSEEDLIGSTRVFSALHASLCKQKKMALVWFIARKNAAPVLAAMVAGPEQRDEESGEQELPAGLWLIPVPFADDLRDVPDTRVIPASDALVDRMRVVVQQLQLPKARYLPSKYPNPALQWHYRILQAMALDEDLPEKPDDRTLPRFRQIQKRAGDYVLAWGQQLEEDHRQWQRHAPELQVELPKRARPPGEGKEAAGPLSKKVKREEGANGVSDADMRAAWKDNRVHKFTVAELKSWAVTKGISDKGKKADIVDAVEAWFDS